MQPNFIARDSLKVPKSLLAGVPHRLSFDGGATLTKILFVKEFDEANFSLELLLVHKKEFADTLRWIRDNGCLLKCDGTDVVKMTGVNSEHPKIVKEIFKADCEFVIEVLTMLRGCHWLVTSLDDEQVFDEPVPPEPAFQLKIDNELVAALTEKMSVKDVSSAKFPSLLVQLGSGSMISALSASGKMDSFHFSMLSGKSLQGLAALLIGTSDYDEIFSLAERGSRAGVDLLVSEMLGDDPNSPYGRFPGELPMMYFGKLAERRIEPGQAKKEDVARSLVALFCANLFGQLSSICSLSGIGRVYFSGNFFRHRLARVEFENIKAILGASSFRHFYLRAGGHVGAFGALVGNNSEAPAFLKLG